jgi:GT2 family glycosyltransferase
MTASAIQQTKYDLSASIVTFNTDPDQLRSAVESFSGTQLRHRFVIIDNSSVDELRRVCAELNVEYIFTGQNLGFGRAHNIALEKYVHISDYHLIVNPDVYFDAGVLDTIHNFMEKSRDVGLVMPRVLYPDESIQYLCKRLPTPLDVMARRFLPPFLKSILRDRLARYEFRDRGYDEIMDVPCLSGCFMFVRSSVLEEVGFFDERFFMYFEDFDLARRIHARARTVFFPDVDVYHHYQKGSYRSFRLLLSHARSAIAYFNKWGWILDEERRQINQATIGEPRRIHAARLSNDELY